MKVYRAAVVGSGLAAAVYHLPAQQALPEVQTVAICGRNETSLRREAAAFGIKNIYFDYSEMLDKEKLDLVAICLPPEHHLPVTKAAAARGVHVLCEKPMVISPSENSEIVKIVEDSQIQFMVAANFWWVPYVLDAKRRLDSGIIGDLFHVRIEEFINEFNPERYWRSNERFLISEMTVHYVDMARRLVGGDVVRVHAITRRVPNQGLTGENFATIAMEFGNGVVARIDDCWCAARGDQFVMRMRIDGTKGCIELNAPERSYAIYSDDEEVQGWLYPESASGVVKGHRAEFGFTGPWPVQDLVQGEIGVYRAFIEALESGAEPPAGVVDFARTMEAVFAAYESAETQQVVEIGPSAETRRGASA